MLLKRRHKGLPLLGLALTGTGNISTAQKYNFSLLFLNFQCTSTVIFAYLLPVDCHKAAKVQFIAVFLHFHCILTVYKYLQCDSLDWQDVMEEVGGYLVMV